MGMMDDEGEARGRSMRGGMGFVMSGDKSAFADKRDKETGIEIKKDGKVEVRGAKVTAVSATQVTATTTLGSVLITISANIDANTKVEAKNGKTIALSEVVVGDVVTLKGMMLSGNAFSMTATLVRDISKSVTPVVNDTRQVFEGKVTVLPGATLPTTITMTIGSTPLVVNISGSTTVLNTAWAPVALSTFQVGDSVRVFGYIPTGASAVTGVVVRNVSR
jgi:hypothetical protein